MIISTLFIITFTLSLLTFWLLLKHLDYDVFKITIFNVYLYFLMAFSYLGIPILYFMLDDYRAAFVTDRNLILQLFYYSIISLYLTTIIYLFIDRLVCTPTDSKNSVPNIETDIGYRLTLYLGIALFLIGLSVFALYGAQVGFTNLPLYVAAFGDKFDVALARSRTGAEIENLRWYNLFMQDMLFIGTLILVLNCKRHIRNIPLKMVGLASIVIVTAIIFMAGAEKIKIVQLILGLFIAFSLLASNRFSVSKFVFPMGIAFLALIASYWTLMGDDSLGAALNGITSRTLTAQLQAAYHHLDYIAMTGNYLHGTTFPNPKEIFPFEPVSFSQELMIWVHGEDALGIRGSFPAIYWAEMYVNFGTIGIITGSVFIGLYLGVLDWLLRPKNKDILAIAFYTWFILHFKDFAITSLANFIIDTHFVIMASILFSMKLVITSEASRKLQIREG